MFLVPIPESWDPAEHGWLPATTKIEPKDGTDYLLRFQVSLRFPASLAVYRNSETGQRVALYGPLASDADPFAPVPQGELLAEIGISPEDWGPEDQQPEAARHG
jgi:hypothetical protein